MSSLYDRLLELLQDADAPRELALNVIEALREGDAAVWRLGVASAEWKTMVDALADGARTADGAYRAEELRQHTKVWELLRPQLQLLGCRVERDPTYLVVWHVSGPGVGWEIDLRTGSVQDHYGPQYDLNADLVGVARRGMAEKASQLEDKARRRALNDNNYVWCNKMKVYIDQVGDRPPIPAGGSFEG